MASLKTLTGGGQQARDIRTYYVYNTSIGGSVNDGGQCCCVVIPTGFRSATVELWGGGGTGGGSCCCMWPYTQASPGSYVYTEIVVVAGEYYQICAAGSNTCSPTCLGQDGLPSYIRRNGLTVCACAHGGCAGTTLCFNKALTCTGVCVPSSLIGLSNIGCLSVCGHRGMSQASNFCHTDNIETAAGSPKYGQNTRLGASNCFAGMASQGCSRILNHWPGGPGNGAGACGGGCCWSGWGAGGLVIMTIYS